MKSFEALILLLLGWCLLFLVFGGVGLAFGQLKPNAPRYMRVASWSILVLLALYGAVSLTLGG